MSSELERLLRDAREALPGDPDELATHRARRASIASVRRSRQRSRLLLVVGAMVVSAVALSVTVGSLNAPGVTAARQPGALSFVPEPGWFALQSPPPAVFGTPLIAVAANVPIHPDDAEHGLVDPTGLPYSTLLELAPKGIVIVAALTAPTPGYVATNPTTPLYPRTKLPLRLQDASPYLQWGAQVRPDEPLAAYQLRAEIDGVYVDVTLYFGTAAPTSTQRAAAQRQLERLVIRSEPSAGNGSSAEATTVGQTVSVIDRTYACNTEILGGLYQVEARAHAGIRAGAGWSKLPYAVVSTGPWAGLLIGYPYARDNSLVWITAGAASSDTTVDHEGESFPVHTGGTLGVNRSLCRPSTAAVRFGSVGLRGGSVDAGGVEVDCDAPRRVVMRLRATVDSAASLRRRANVFLATNVVVRRAELAVRTPAGRLLAYADVAQSGKARLFVAKGCTQG